MLVELPKVWQLRGGVGFKFFLGLCVFTFCMHAVSQTEGASEQISSSYIGVLLLTTCMTFCKDARICGCL